MFEDGEAWFGKNPDADGQVYKDKIAEYEAITIQIEAKCKVEVPKEEAKDEDNAAGEVNAEGDENEEDKTGQSLKTARTTKMQSSQLDDCQGNGLRFEKFGYFRLNDVTIMDWEDED